MCPRRRRPGSYGLHLTGTAAAGDAVTFGSAPALGASTFTLETWFRRDAVGVATNTGTGGVVAIPLVTKGMAETEGSTVDMNYFLGIRASDNVLVADFEEGTAHRLESSGHRRDADVDNVWHHAAATYDGTTWRLYLNGALQTQLVVGAFTPRADSIQHAALGTALNSTGGVGTRAGLLWRHAGRGPHLELCPIGGGDSGREGPGHPDGDRPARALELQRALRSGDRFIRQRPARHAPRLGLHLGPGRATVTTGASLLP